MEYVNSIIKNVAIFLQTVLTDLGEIFQGILIHRFNVGQLSNYKVKRRSTSCQCTILLPCNGNSLLSSLCFH